MSAHGTELRDHVPPLRVHHLLVWMAVAAALMGFERVVADRFAALAPTAVRAETSVIWGIEAAIGYGFSAAAITLASFTVYWKFKGFDALAQPGQWLPLPALLSPILLLLSYYGSCRVLSERIAQAADTNLAWYFGPTPVAMASFVLLLGNHAAPTVLFAWCFRRIADSRAWQICFFALVAPHAFHVLRWIFNSAGLSLPYEVLRFTAQHMPVIRLAAWHAASTIELLALATAAGNDIFRGKPRAWTHWAGVVVAFAGRLLAVTTTVGWLFA